MQFCRIHVPFFGPSCSCILSCLEDTMRSQIEHCWSAKALKRPWSCLILSLAWDAESTLLGHLGRFAAVPSPLDRCIFSVALRPKWSKMKKKKTTIANQTVPWGNNYIILKISIPNHTKISMKITPIIVLFH